MSSSTIVYSSNWEVMEAADDKEVSENLVSIKNISTVTSTNNNMKGVQLILCSLLGISTAAGITITRWILSETGEVLLLFANNNNDQLPVGDDDVCENYYMIDSDITSTCTIQDYNHQSTSLSKQIGVLIVIIGR